MQEIIDVTKEKFGLEDYYLRRHRIERSVDIVNKTNYILSMEWFPADVAVQEDEDTNPDGAAVIEMYVNSQKVKSAIFVGGKTYAKNGVTFTNINRKYVIEWIEKETKLLYGEQFQLHKEDEREYHFKECINGIAVSPSGYIELQVNQEGQLTFFSVNGQFPSKDLVNEETYSLSLDRVEHLAKQQIQFAEFPLFDKERLVSAYVIDEIYITNDGKETLPFVMVADGRPYVQIEQTIGWDEAITIPFKRKELQLLEEVTVEQAFLTEASPDSLPITKDEEEKCVTAVRNFLRQEYPDESGKWSLKTLHRENGYIQAILRRNKQTSRVFQRKLLLMIDGKSFLVSNFIDNKPLMTMFDLFQASDRVNINKEEASEKLKDFVELKSVYVYDFKQKHYILCGKLDCQYGVNASNGEVVSLDEL